MTRKLAVPLAIAASCALAGASAWAASPLSPITKSFQAKALVNANCSLGTIPDLNFGTYDPVVSNAASAQVLSAQVNFTLACTQGSSPVIQLSLGSNSASASGTRRAMNSGATGAGNYLSYELYTPSALGAGASATTTVWGDGSTGTSAYSPFGAGTAPNRSQQTITINGTVPGGQDVRIGSYSDTVTATVNF